MIVFTATDQVTGKVFAGSTRRSLEDHWGHLLVQESEGAMGEFFETLRSSGADSFKMEEWGYSDNPKELREMLAEAMEALGARAIKVTLTRPENKSKPSMDLMKELEALKQEMSDGSDDPDYTPKKKEAVVKPEAPKTVPKAEPKPLRHTASTREAEEMRALIAGIEARRRGGTKAGQKAAKKAGAAGLAKAAKSASGAAENAAPVSRPKLSEGRTGSAAKEKRIREAIAAEKAELEAQKRNQASDEAKEMREIMARLDQRTKETARIHRRL
ncbi:hypothetical protein HCH_00423 [Hahella chejuensis KCTC 2396]|uniref:Uncharacterized protein n=1 Tax=Hahella chejuensis (strain KCTC 2396) TaxID=349521 RepID=Q2SPU1_HAHCH|nr:hypothetical protein [Hahella chejuensis]ABC27333.1 hypothetical protein HCH_00423 [Hahella chejuensis KCTC 2396]